MHELDAEVVAVREGYDTSNKNVSDAIQMNWTRTLSSTLVNEFVRQVLAADKRANVLVLGDINDFDFSETTEILEVDPSAGHRTGLPAGTPVAAGAALLDTFRIGQVNSTALAFAFHNGAPGFLGGGLEEIDLIPDFTVPRVLLVVLSMTAGTAMVMWLGVILMPVPELRTRPRTRSGSRTRRASDRSARRYRLS